MRLLVIVVFVMTSLAGFAQAEKKAKGEWKIRSLNQAGIINGEAGSVYSVQSILGVEHCSWMAGIGVGIDDYKVRGIPLFFDLRKEWGNARNAFFLYGDAGIHFHWMTSKQEDEQFHGWLWDSKSNGLYTDLGLGYRLTFNNKNSILVSAGYTYKDMEAIVSTPPWYFDVLRYTFHYRLNRLTMKIGWMF